MDENRALIYNMQQIKEQLTASEFQDALSEFQIVHTMTHELFGIRAMEIQSPDNRFSESECWQAELEGKSIVFTARTDPFAANLRPDNIPEKQVKPEKGPSLTSIIIKSIADYKAAREEAKAARNNIS